MDTPPEPKPHFDFGHLVHALVLRKGATIAEIGADDYKTQTARALRDAAHERGEIPALTKDIHKAALIANQVLAHPIAGPLLREGDAEVSLFATDPDTGLKIRGRVDWMTTNEGRLTIVDLKTAADANPKVFARKAYDYGYHIQFAWYVTLARLLELDEYPAFLFAVVEKEPPYLTSVVELDTSSFIQGCVDMRRAIDIFQRCTETGVWPGYGDYIHSVSLPPWAFNTNQPTIGDLLEIN
jgi:hypothetical protein